MFGIRLAAGQAIIKGLPLRERNTTQTGPGLRFTGCHLTHGKLMAVPYVFEVNRCLE